MCEQSYWNPLEDPPHQSPLDDPLRKGSNTKNYALSRRPRVYTGEKYDWVYTPLFSIIAIVPQRTGYFGLYCWKRRRNLAMWTGMFPMLCVYLYSLKRTGEATNFSKQKFALHSWDLLFSVLKIFFSCSILEYMMESISHIVPEI